MLSLLEVLQKTADFFGTKGIENPRLNAELLLGHALGLKRMQLYMQFERLLPESDLEKIRPLVRRRGQREPLQYIVGSVEFAGLTLKVDRRALIPRPETELLVELIASRLGEDARGAILDLGTGSGALALGLASRYAEAQVVAVDADSAALDLARENAEATGLGDRVKFVRSDWFNGVSAESRFQLIVANPPYLTEAEAAAAEPEVRLFEPAQALVAPAAGLEDLLAIIKRAPDFLAPGGLLALETGIDQHAALSAAIEAAGLERGESVNDLTGRPRFVFARGGAGLVASA